MLLISIKDLKHRKFIKFICTEYSPIPGGTSTLGNGPSIHFWTPHGLACPKAFLWAPGIYRRTIPSGPSAQRYLLDGLHLKKDCCPRPNRPYQVGFRYLYLYSNKHEVKVSFPCNILPLYIDVRSSRCPPVPQCLNDFT